MSDKPITVSVGTFCRLMQIGKTKAYDIINNKGVDTIHVGRRRLVILSSVHDLIERCRRQEGDS